MRVFNYSAIRERKWDSEILGLVAAMARSRKAGTVPETAARGIGETGGDCKGAEHEASNAIEGIVTTNTRIRQLVEEKRRRETGMSKRLQVTGCAEPHP